MELNSHPLESSTYRVAFNLERWGRDQLIRTLNREYGNQLIDDQYQYWVSSDRIPAEGRIVIRLSKQLELVIFGDDVKRHQSVSIGLFSRYNGFLNPISSLLPAER